MQTTANGILVVQAINNSTTSVGAFSLSHPLRAGAYDYRLFKGGLNPNDPTVLQDWFLRSTLVQEPTVRIIGPELSTYGSVLPTAIDMVV